MSDNDTTEQMPAPEEPPTQPQPDRPRRLYRSRRDRVFFGVAGGLGDYFRVDPLILRIAFGVSVFFGGLGVIVYLAFLILVPSQPGDGATELPERSRTGRVLGALAIVALAIAAACGLCALALAALWAGATGSGELVAVVIVAIGAMLAIAAFRGGARWLIVPALALAVPLSAVAAADLEFDGGIGEREHRPVSASALPDDGYELGIGRLVVDLRDVEWNPSTVIRTTADLGIGELVVAVPESVCVTGDLESGAGVVEVAGDEQDGWDVESHPVAGTAAKPRLVIDGRVDLGALHVINDDDASLDDRGHGGPFDDDDDDVDRTAMRDAMAAACAPDPAERKARRGGAAER